MNMKPKTLCDDCIHSDVCNDEGHLDPGMVYCVSQLSEDTVGFLGRKHGLLLVTVQQLITYKYFTVIQTTGEVNSQDAARHPANYKVLNIDYAPEEDKIVVTIEPIK